MTDPGTPKSIQQILSERLPEEIGTARDFERWFEPLKNRVLLAVQRVHDDVGAALDAAREKIHEREGCARDVWFLTGTDGESLMKSVASVRSKLGRELLEREATLLAGRMSLDQIEKLLLSFRDLGRFRVVCDLSLDVKEARKVLFPRSEKTLLDRYPLFGEIKDFSYDLELRKLVRGHRAQQFTLEVDEDGGSVRVEIQLMTLLQNAWDHRNHPLYEWDREGGSLPPSLRVNDVALAETLHLVDEQASRNWLEFLEIRKESR